jgi:hypothetical protein
MATKILQPPIQASPVISPNPRATKIIKTQRFLPATHPWTKSTILGDCPSGFTPIYTTKVTEQSSGSGIVGDETLAQIKTELSQAVQGMPNTYNFPFILLYCNENGGQFEVKFNMDCI